MIKNPLKMVLLIALCATSVSAEPVLRPNERIVFLGDSITHAGGYVAFVEAHLAMTEPGERYDIINLGLSSETACGLSEPYHPWPRPNVHERLGRVLAKVKPAVVVACYGMNDGVYHPFSEDRFKTYRDGINKLVADCNAAGARVILVTPPPYDPLANPKATRDNPDGSTELGKRFGYRSIYRDYDRDVIGRYAKWIVERGEQDDVAASIDIHTPINAYMTKVRETKPGFKMSGDGVHVDKEGHRQIAAALLAGLGQPDADLSDAALAKVMTPVSQRMGLLRGAWLNEVGHKRPGGTKGEPLVVAKKKAAALSEQILNATGAE